MGFLPGAGFGGAVGNADPVYGRDSCRDQLERFYAGIEAVRHDVIEEWEHGNATIVEANLTCTRTDGREFSLPVVTIFRITPRT